MSEQKWREVYESVEGNCMHELPKLKDGGYHGDWLKCMHCGEKLGPMSGPLPLPLTLDALMEVAEKLDVWKVKQSFERALIGDRYICYVWVDAYTPTADRVYGSTPQLALLNALHQATEHRRK